MRFKDNPHMTASIDQIRKPVEQELETYESCLKESFRSGYPFIQSILDHIISGRGKGIRPLLVLLSASLHHKTGGRLPYDSSLGAMLIEMVHNASLVHDDIVDAAPIRRGRASVNALFHSHAAVLIGDYILSLCYLRGFEHGTHRILSSITRSMGELCEGELLQTYHNSQCAMTRQTYYDIIYKKTATLIGTSCEVGAISVGANDSDTRQMKHFGDMLGMAFQIKDDIIDYSDPAITGKPRCGDIREHKINLPLLTVLEEAAAEEREAMMKLLDTADNDAAAAERLADMVISRGGIEKATAVMDGFIGKAVSALEPYPDSDIRRSLAMLCTFVAEREK